jgi:hypothetical protein
MIDIELSQINLNSSNNSSFMLMNNTLHNLASNSAKDPFVNNPILFLQNLSPMLNPMQCQILITNQLLMNEYIKNQTNQSNQTNQTNQSNQQNLESVTNSEKIMFLNDVKRILFFLFEIKYYMHDYDIKSIFKFKNVIFTYEQIITFLNKNPDLYKFVEKPFLVYKDIGHLFFNKNKITKHLIESCIYDLIEIKKSHKIYENPDSIIFYNQIYDFIYVFYFISILYIESEYSHNLEEVNNSESESVSKKIKIN